MTRIISFLSSSIISLHPLIFSFYPVSFFSSPLLYFLPSSISHLFSTLEPISCRMSNQREEEKRRLNQWKRGRERRWRERRGGWTSERERRRRWNETKIQLLLTRSFYRQPHWLVPLILSSVSSFLVIQPFHIIRGQELYSATTRNLLKRKGGRNEEWKEGEDEWDTEIWNVEEWKDDR